MAVLPRLPEARQTRAWEFCRSRSPGAWSSFLSVRSDTISSSLAVYFQEEKMEKGDRNDSLRGV